MKACLVIANKSIPYSELRSRLPELRDQAVEKWNIQLLDLLEAWLSDVEYFDVQTSGSTGEPTLIKVHREDLILSARLTAEFLNLKAGMSALLTLPVEFIAGTMMVIRAISIDMDLHVNPPSSNPFIGLNTNPDFIAITPHQLVVTLRNSASRMRLSKIPLVLIGGGAIPPHIIQEIRHWKNRMYHSFGMTETLSHIAMSLLNSENSGNFNLISPMFVIQSDIDNCLVIETPFRHAKRVLSRDIVKITGPGSFIWLGRADNAINVGGIKAFPEALESLLFSLIKEPFFITSTPHESLGQTIVLVVESMEKEKFMSTKFSARMSEVIRNRHLVPKEIIVLKKFEYTASGKISRNKTLQLHGGNKNGS